MESPPYNAYMQGQDIAILLKSAIRNDPSAQSKAMAESLSISPFEMSRARKRCVGACILDVSETEMRLNRTGLMEFLAHGLK